MFPRRNCHRPRLPLSRVNFYNFYRECQASSLSSNREPIEEYGQASRTISTASLKASRLLHSQPINPVVFRGPLDLSSCDDKKGNLILRRVSRLDAFSVYPYRTPLPSDTPGGITGIQEVRSTRSSRTMVDSSQVS